MSRRAFLASAAALGLGGYSYYRGLRFPRLSFEHAPIESAIETPESSFTLFNLIEVKNDSTKIHFRAIAPEPALHILTSSGVHRFSVNNVANEARLRIEGLGIELVDEEVNGINREVTISSKTEQELKLHWALDSDDGIDFAVIGDTGGGSELAWTLKRATQLDAKFLLHLGDFNYGGNEYDQAIALFKQSPIPCYITIGNHDFHDNGLIYQKFLDHLGPMNHAFEVAGSRFINVDTAASFLPVASGHRGRLINQLIASPFDGEQIFFTHRPIKDPRPHDDHDLGSASETHWLAKSIKKTGSGKLLTGHVHHSAELEFMGIKQITAGEGLGYEDIVPKKQISKILIARSQPHAALEHSWHDLNMPWAAHQNPAHEKKLSLQGHTKELEWYLTEMPNLKG